MEPRGRAPLRTCLVALLAGLLGAGCSRPPRPDHPNILFVVWDTVRADHLGLYGYPRPTTPHLDAWAAEHALVFDDCVSISSTTVPSHASLFTGLAPREHGVHNDRPLLRDRFDTLAEKLGRAGYASYAFSSNPYLRPLGERASLTQGFDVVEHPGRPKYREAMSAILWTRVRPEDRSNELPALMREGQVSAWYTLAGGSLAQRGVEEWLAEQDGSRPFFVFLNYMEAHRPLLPLPESRARLMSPEEIRRSYRVDRSVEAIWRYNFGFREYDPDELALTAATYDAALTELDEYLHRLLESLRAKGRLDDTIVVLTSDHGEHLGEHHLLEHQFSLYEELLRVPLVLSYPGVIAPGRESRPVMNVDVFPTLLELAGIEPPEPRPGGPRSLLAPADERRRIAEYPSPLRYALEVGRRLAPGFDESRWNRSLEAVYAGPWKLIRGSNGEAELYRVGDDPGEQTDLARERPAERRRLESLLHALSAVRAPDAAEGEPAVLPDDVRRQLEALGYLGNAPE